MKYKFFGAGLIACALTIGGALTAQSAVIVSSDNGTLFNTGGLTGFTTDGTGMVGMAVTAIFADTSSETIAWASSGGTSGSASGTDWALFETGDTFGGVWTLANITGQAITDLIINGVPGDTIFDRSAPSPGSPDSFSGLDFFLDGGNTFLGDITATYRNALGIGGAAPVGDLFTQLELEFTSAGAFASGSTLTFVADTDSAATAGDITEVSEPGMLVIFGLGLVGLGVARRRRA